MEITVKSTQLLEASSCWAGGQPFTHQSSLKFQFISSRVFFLPALHYINLKLVFFPVMVL